jgi:hypothetical protein
MKEQNFIFLDPIPGYENYEISENGEIYSVKLKRLLKPFVYGNYYRINLQDENKKIKKLRVHRLVAKTFIPNLKNYPVVNHKDGNGLNNNISNLEWCTISQNTQHAHDNSLINQYGIKINKLNEEGEVLETFDSISSAARSMNVHHEYIRRAVNKNKMFNGFIWQKIEENEDEIDIDENIEWVTIKGYPDYEITNNGIVRNKKTKRILSTYINNEGYAVVKVFNNKKEFKRRIHRLVASTFIPNPDNLPQVNHKDKNRLNNDIKNLEWCTSKHNSRHSHNNGNHKGHVQVKQYSKDNEFIKEFETIVQASNETGANVRSIQKCLKGEAKTAGGFVWKRKNEEKIIKKKVDENKETKNKISVLKLNHDTEEVLKEYPSIRKAAEDNNIDPRCISLAIKKNGTSAGFKWKYKHEDKVYHKTALEIKQIDPKTNKVIETYKNASEASRQTGILAESIRKVARGERKTAGGYIWK